MSAIYAVHHVAFTQKTMLYHKPQQWSDLNHVPTDNMNVVPQALITVSNHVAALDDPLLTAALVPAGALLQPSALRWTLCATDRCFTSRAATTFFRAAKAGPLSHDVTPHNKKYNHSLCGVHSLSHKKVPKAQWLTSFSKSVTCHADVEVTSRCLVAK